MTKIVAVKHQNVAGRLALEVFCLGGNMSFFPKRLQQICLGVKICAENEDCQFTSKDNNSLFGQFLGYEYKNYLACNLAL